MGKRIAGALLVALSAVAVVQSVRELWMWEAGGARYEEQSQLELPLRYGGHTFTVRDDQPNAAVNDEVGHEATMRVLMDGKPLGPPSRALVRRGRRGLGRYHGWLDAWSFRERETGRTSLWIARRLQPREGGRPEFEVMSIEERGTPRIRRLGRYQLGASYPLFRATQFVRDGSPFPLSMLGAAYLWPIVLVFPLGTLVLGALWMRDRPAAGT